MPKPGQLLLPKPPTKGTLRSYGLTEADWYRMAGEQKGICPICEGQFADRKLAVDHEHVRGFKARKKRRAKKAKGEDGKRKLIKVRAMLPAERRVHVRGILHAYCNRFVRSWLTLPRARSIVAYLEAHERRKQ